jgi:hypothetical protein
MPYQKNCYNQIKFTARQHLKDVVLYFHPDFTIGDIFIRSIKETGQPLKTAVKYPLPGKRKEQRIFFNGWYLATLD